MESYPEKSFDVIICGAGHAGCEAALAATRIGARALILTGNIDSIAQMSCNPAIGGQAKGQIVREIDALGGEMALNSDTTGIQFRLLNASKGPAVQAPRAQCDKKAYQFRMKHILELQENLSLFQGIVSELIIKKGRICGVNTNLGIKFFAESVIVTTGTFLRGMMHIGKNQNEGGRLGDFASNTLSSSLIKSGIKLKRLKTGTPPRILGSSIDFKELQEQKGDEKPTFFSFFDTRGPENLFHVEQIGQRKLGWKPGTQQVSCWTTHTSSKTNQLVRRNLTRSPLYEGIIEGVGPRYCPSIEDKVVRFAQRERHLVFLEPEGRNTDEWYVNGMSTSLPFDVQIDMLRSVKGLEAVKVLRPAYAVEYDFAPPTQLLASLESKKIEGLFFAGQINGTSGYEEAAAQGLIAGVNAVMKVRGQEPLILGRDEAYIGVLIDDLVTKGTKEPYRMFTSRAEYRLMLNHGSAEIRLGQHAKKYKLLNEHRLGKIHTKIETIKKWIKLLEEMKSPNGSYGDFIRRGRNPTILPEEFLGLNQAIKDEVLYKIGFRGYLERESRQAEKFKSLDSIKIPQGFEYKGITGLKEESIEKLESIKPYNLGQAGRISGVNPTDINILMVVLAKSGEKQV
ncbi:MAG: tRNA uridine 5-carboxymethylaminomethyl modification enzyme MnmG [Candidatus Moanabacter tarae]|uniref:tRNA uridine 5-carboxymethylaminomethyl modification enzyme MnmG n=1 Tax=Candidatus Moanibacter tarae TaxID=2200854 RepID=A0A2Z4AN55_9BACT|nr:MAG: tRNA uridine 5-carboxymethylaminomethyl modification enzyme MnmG [Candidatus Moanabacter tarae]|tara:strand:- start:14 stop:1885 length:1872 start_codon:yes stop_codon:yes gene_type:complete